jgi:threonine/homoserine/homoserine lactone efflux protein
MKRSSLKKYFAGLRFGLLLQIAIGPMCLMVFNAAKNNGFFAALPLVLAIALVDAFYITLASLGANKILENKKVKNISKMLGAAVLVLFGLNIILGVFGINFIPALNLEPTTTNLFLQGLVLTLSNPITIAFWGSVLTVKIIDEKMTKKELAVFSSGLVSATLLFLSLVAVLGTILAGFISKNISDILNVIVGVAIIAFGIRILVKKEDHKKRGAHND